MKTASNRAIQKTAEVAGDLNGNKIADRITSISKSSKCFKRIAFKNRWEWNRNTKRKIYIQGKKTTNYWELRLV